MKMTNNIIRNAKINDKIQAVELQKEFIEYHRKLTKRDLKWLKMPKMFGLKFSKNMLQQEHEKRFLQNMMEILLYIVPENKVVIKLYENFKN